MKQTVISPAFQRGARTAVLSASILVLSACGGGSGGPASSSGVNSATEVNLAGSAVGAASGGTSGTSGTSSTSSASGAGSTGSTGSASSTGSAAANNAAAAGSGTGVSGSTTAASTGVSQLQSVLAVGASSVTPAPANNWTRCASEGELCTFSGTQQVRYGSAGQYIYQVATDSIPCTNGMFSDPASGLRKTCDYAPLVNGGASGTVYRRMVSGRVLGVGPGKPYAMPCDALRAAGDGDLVEIDAAGNYDGDVCAFGANDLTIRGVNGRPRINAAGRNAWGKGTWVVTGSRAVIENVELSGASVPDQNGAAIRLDGVHLTLRDSYLHDNENGILTSNDYASDILVERTEFSRNGFGNGYSHNLYIGHVSSLTFRFNYTHDANVGNNLKSRATVNNILYNRISSQDGSGAYGQPSWEIDLPNAGTAYLIGNVIEQPAAYENSNMVSFGTEGANNLGQSLYVINNTFLNDAGSGSFLLLGGDVATPALVRNNVFAGAGGIINQGSAVLAANYQGMAPAFVNRSVWDLRPMAGAPFAAAGSDPGYSSSGVRLAPLFEYVHVAGWRPRAAASPMSLGAYAAQ